MRVLIAAVSVVILAMAACGLGTEPGSESASRDGTAQGGEPPTGLLLSEDSAISIVQTFLQECVLSWNVEHVSAYRKMQRGGPVPSDQGWWMDLASGKTGGIEWSTQHHGVTEVLFNHGIRAVPQTFAETWIVIGPGFRRVASGLAVVPGRWQVYAGHRSPYALDAPARLALEEYKRPLDSYFDRNCSGY